MSQNVNEWNWSFGDGANSTEQNPTHIYSMTGNYTVNLSVANANGTDSKTETINVLGDSSSSNDKDNGENSGSSYSDYE